ncbi:hypothetical protein DFP72DRAFT_844272 [Ephemerocybe angulata]|uniref:Uncharacterized protein n=1 Tax=Ephemerocybe angulata TaxID=980116 RepID=A0A8H6I811_9AGAR|nr:hypothetical protein DFP72DRAFT_844272 [Tulosesus angulatus]
MLLPGLAPSAASVYAVKQVDRRLIQSYIPPERAIICMAEVNALSGKVFGNPAKACVRCWFSRISVYNRNLSERFFTGDEQEGPRSEELERVCQALGLFPTLEICKTVLHRPRHNLDTVLDSFSCPQRPPERRARQKGDDSGLWPWLWIMASICSALQMARWSLGLATTRLRGSFRADVFFVSSNDYAPEQRARQPPPPARASQTPPPQQAVVPSPTHPPLLPTSTPKPTGTSASKPTARKAAASNKASTSTPTPPPHSPAGASSSWPISPHTPTQHRDQKQGASKDHKAAPIRCTRAPSSAREEDSDEEPGQHGDDDEAYVHAPAMPTPLASTNTSSQSYTSDALLIHFNSTHTYISGTTEPASSRMLPIATRLFSTTSPPKSAPTPLALLTSFPFPARWIGSSAAIQETASNVCWTNYLAHPVDG